MLADHLTEYYLDFLHAAQHWRLQTIFLQTIFCQTIVFIPGWADVKSDNPQLPSRGYMSQNGGCGQNIGCFFLTVFILGALMGGQYGGLTGILAVVIVIFGIGVLFVMLIQMMNGG